MGSVNFFSVDIAFSLENESWVRQLLTEIVTLEQFQLECLNCAFCCDDYLFRLNVDYLQHDYFTDILTFDNTTVPFIIDGDLFVSVDRVRENSVYFRVDFGLELLRVLVHGVLHLLGYDDSTPDEIEVMRQKENKYLQLFIVQ